MATSSSDADFAAIVKNGTYCFPADQCLSIKSSSAQAACVRCDDRMIRACVAHKGRVLCLLCTHAVLAALPTFDPNSLVGLTVAEASKLVLELLPGHVLVSVARVDPETKEAVYFPAPGLLACVPHVKVLLDHEDVVVRCLQ